MKKTKKFILDCFINSSLGLKILWCYLFWYLFFLVRYFRWDVSLWLTSLCMSLIVGIALNFNAFGSIAGIRKERNKRKVFALIPISIFLIANLIVNKTQKSDF